MIKPKEGYLMTKEELKERLLILKKGKSLDEWCHCIQMCQKEIFEESGLSQDDFDDVFNDVLDIFLTELGDGKHPDSMIINRLPKPEFLFFKV